MRLPPCFPEVSATFHGRDIFAPVAARISKGVHRHKSEHSVTDYIVLDWPQPVPVKAGMAEGEILHSDRFGNLITNFSRHICSRVDRRQGFLSPVCRKSIKQLVPSYAYAKPGHLCYVFGSTDFLEIAVANGSAARGSRPNGDRQSGFCF